MKLHYPKTLICSVSALICSILYLPAASFAGEEVSRQFRPDSSCALSGTTSFTLVPGDKQYVPLDYSGCESSGVSEIFRITITVSYNNSGDFYHSAKKPTYAMNGDCAGLDYCWYLEDGFTGEVIPATSMYGPFNGPSDYWVSFDGPSLGAQWNVVFMRASDSKGKKVQYGQVGTAAGYR